MCVLSFVFFSECLFLYLDSVPAIVTRRNIRKKINKIRTKFTLKKMLFPSINDTHSSQCLFPDTSPMHYHSLSARSTSSLSDKSTPRIGKYINPRVCERKRGRGQKQARNGWLVDRWMLPLQHRKQFFI